MVFCVEATLNNKCSCDFNLEYFVCVGWRASQLLRKSLCGPPVTKMTENGVCVRITAKQCTF